MTFSVSLKLIADSFVKGLATIKRQVSGFTKFMTGAFALGGITQFGRKMIEVSSEFEDAMARVQAVSNATAEGFKMMEREARHLGATTKFTATEAANALENLTRNGLNATQATQALRGTLQLAQANAIGLAEAANIVTNTMNMFGLTTRDTSHINDVLSRTASTTATNITLLYEALINAAPTAKNLDISLEEVSATLGAMAQRGVKGAEAGTQLRMALTKMVDPKIVKKLKAFGVEIDENVIRNEKWIDVLARLKDANLDLAQLVEIFSQRGAHGVAQLINSYNDLQKTLWEIEDAEGTTERMFQEGLGTTKGALLMLKSAYQEFLIMVGDQSRGAFNGLIRVITAFVRSCNSVEEVLLKLAALIIPMFTRKFIAGFNAIRAAIKSATADAVVFKAAIGDWIGVLITAVSWISIFGTAMRNQVNNELEKFREDVQEAEKANDRLASSTKGVIDKLGGSYSKDTLDGALKEAIRLFPDFKDALMDAALEAGKNKNYKELIDLLNQILVLQQQINLTSPKENELAGLGKKQGLEMMRRATTGTATAYGGQYGNINYAGGFSPENTVLGIVKKGAKDQGKKDVGDWTNYVFTQMGEAINSSATKQEAEKAVKAIVTRYGQVSDEVISQVVTNAWEGETKKAAVILNEEVRSLHAASDKANNLNGGNGPGGGGNGPGGGGSGGKKTPEEIAREKFAKAQEEFAKDTEAAAKRRALGMTDELEYEHEMLRAEKALTDAYFDAAYDLNNQSLLEQDLFKNTVSSYNERNKRIKEQTESLKDQKKSDREYERIVEQLQDIFKEKEAGPKYNKKNKNPWDAFSTDPKEYRADQIALQELEDEMDRLQRLYDEASEKMAELGDSGVEGAAEARDSYKKLGDDLNEMIDKVAEKREELGKKFAKDDIKELSYKKVEGLYNGIKTTTQAVSSLADALQNLKDADWGDMTMLEKFQAITSAIFGITDAIKSVYDSWKSFNEVLNQLTEAKATFAAVSKATSENNAAGATTEAAANLLAAKSEEVKGAAAEQAAKKTAESAMVSVAANTAEAGAGAAASQASIPYVGPILAAAAAAGIIAMLASTLPKFAHGGVVQGNSKYGDRLLARVNAGEMILNKSQQNRLFELANGHGKVGGVGQVEFHISGKELKGILRNMDTANGRISSSL